MYSTHASELSRFQRIVSSKFTITINDPLTEYLGISIETTPDGRRILTQPKLLNAILTEFQDRLPISHKRSIAPQRLPTSLTTSNRTSISSTSCLHLLDMLLYMTKTRPDISTAVSFASTHSSAPTVGDFNEMLYIVRYLQDTAHRGLTLHPGVPGQSLTLTCYVDASYLTHADSKSQSSGYCLSFGSIGSFYSKSSKQCGVEFERKALWLLGVNS